MLLDEVLNSKTNKQSSNSPASKKNNIEVYNIYEEIGAAGTKNFSGVIDEEYLREWRNLYNRCLIIERMLKSDATIKAGCLIHELPIMGAEWDFTIDDDASDDEKRIKDDIEDLYFGEMSHPWSDTLRQTLTYLYYGFSLFEKCYEPDLENKISKLHKLSPRLQKTIKYWWTDGGGGIAGVQQQAYRNLNNKIEYVTKDIPISKLLLFTYRKEGANFEGDPILRSAYKHWYIKDKLYLIQAIGLERTSLGIPIIYLPKYATEEDKNMALDIVKSWKAHQEAGGTLPESVRLEHIIGKMNASALDAAIIHHDMLIAKSMLAQFIQLGSPGSSGSWALSKDHSDLLLMSLNSIANDIAGVHNRYMIRPYIDMNYKDKYKINNYPKIRCREISKLSNRDSLDALISLKNAGFIELPDPKLEEWARQTNNLPPRDESRKLYDVLNELAQKYPDSGTMNQSSQDDVQGQVNSLDPKSLELVKSKISPKQSAGSDGDRGEAGESGEGMSEKTYHDIGESYHVRTALDELIKLREELTHPWKFEEEPDYGKSEDAIDIGKMVEDSYASVIKEQLPEFHKALEKYGYPGWSDDDLKRVINIMTESQRKKIADTFTALLADIELTGKPRLDNALKVLEMYKEYKLAEEDTGMEDIYAHSAAAELIHPTDTHSYQHNVRAQHTTPHRSYNYANAPVVRDPRTGRYKYAKGAEVNGVMVGGQWAPVVGGGVLASAAVVGAYKVLNLKFKKDASNLIRRGLSSKIAESPLLRAELKKFNNYYEEKTYPMANGGYGIKYSLYTGEHRRLSGIFGADVGITHPNTVTGKDISLVDSLNKLGYEIGEEYSSTGKLQKIVKIKGKNAKVLTDHIWNILDNTKDSNGNIISKSYNRDIRNLFERHGFGPDHGPSRWEKWYKRPSYDFNSTIDEIVKLGKDFKKGADVMSRDVRVMVGSKGSAVQKGIGGVLASLAVFTTYELWNHYSRQLLHRLKNLPTTLSGRVLSSEEAELHRLEYERQKRESMKYGMVGRPRVNPELPEELRRGRGRPFKTEAEKEQERKRRVEEYKQKWRAENVVGYDRAMSELEETFKFDDDKKKARKKFWSNVAERSISTAIGTPIAGAIIYGSSRLGSKSKVIKKSGSLFKLKTKPKV